MHKKFHKYNAIIRGLSLVSLVSIVLATKSCDKKKSSNSKSILIAENKPIKQNNLLKKAN